MIIFAFAPSRLISERVYVNRTEAFETSLRRTRTDYNFAGIPPGEPTAISAAHSIEHRISRSTSSMLFPACRQIRTRSFPFGTVGHVMARAFSPCVLSRAANGRGYHVINGTIGVASCDGIGADANGWRCDGSERICGVIGGSECRSRSVRVAVRCPPSAKTWLESCDSGQRRALSHGFLPPHPHAQTPGCRKSSWPRLCLRSLARSCRSTSARS